LNFRKNTLYLLTVGLALAAALVSWPRTKSPSPPITASGTSRSASRAGTDQSAVPGEQALAERLRAASISLGASGANVRQQLAELRRALSTASANAAAAAIRRFLDSKADALTGQGFKIGAQGRLEEAPTLRTFLLDYLGQIEPTAAAAYARVILSSKDSPDEWAVALRSLAKGDPSAGGRTLLEQRVGDLLRYEPWQRNPSAGYLESFDAAVFLGGTNFVPALTELLRRQDNPALAHAAFLAMDRLVINDPAGLLGALEADPGLMQGREQTRADYFARTDVRSPQQRQVLENYLLDPRTSQVELAQFAGLYPNVNFMISPNLLTPTPTPDHAALTGRDARSLQVVQEWLADPRFAKLRPQLEKMKGRLEDFARPAAGR
jgi:hypothetical protein